MSEDLATMTAVELVRRYRDRSLSPVEVAKATFARIREANPAVNAFVFTVEDEAMAAAAASEARWRKGAPLGPVDGVTATIKDLALMKGHPTLKGSLTTPREGPWDEDSPCTARLRESGAVLLGKTTTPEFGWAGVTHSPLTGVTRNPWDATKTSGGSSGGAGAAAALGMGALNIGTDGGGSIRMPASFCGVFGLKPTTGRVPYYPASAMGTCSAVGPMTRTVADAALTMNVIARPDARDWHFVPRKPEDYLDALETGAKGLRIAYAAKLFGASPDPEIAASVAAAARAFRAMGAEVEAVGPLWESPREPYETFYYANLGRVFRTLAPEQQAVVDPGFRAYAQAGLEVSLAAFQDAEAAQAALGAKVHALFERFDLLLSPQLLVTAFEAGVEVPAGRAMTRWFDWAPYTYPFNFSNHPAASVPCGFDKAGLPVSFQLVGPKLGDFLVLRGARAYEQAHPFRLPKKPPESV